MNDLVVFLFIDLLLNPVLLPPNVTNLNVLIPSMVVLVDVTTPLLIVLP